MNTTLSCIPCLLRQSVDAVGLCDVTTETSHQFIREILLAATTLDFSRPPPLLAGQLQAQLREITGCDDPYHELKRQHNRLACSLLTSLAQAVHRAADPFAAAVRLAIAGNVIDLGAKSRLTPAEIQATVAGALEHPLVGELEPLRTAIVSARRILYLTDNAGEIVFDRVLVDLLPRNRVTVAVRGRSVLNDATVDDATTAGLSELAEIISNGSAVPGTVLSDCSPDFRRRFAEADLIIAKGQGNFETLHEEHAPLFCLFRVKCEIVAEHCGHPVGSHLVWKARLQ